MLVKRSSLRILLGVGIIMSSLTALVGCENFYNYGPYSLGIQVNGDLVILSCEPRSVKKIYVEERSGQQRTIIWRASGSQELRVGGRIVVGSDNKEFLTEEIKSPNPRPGVEYFFGMNRNNYEVASALFQIPEGGLPVGKWLDPRGNVSDQPCERVIDSW